jgi:hypothetical protein
MHEHDLDLIAALADGSGSDEPLARSLVETCPTCRAEYEAQRNVIGWLRAAPTPVMTDLERAELYRAVRSGLGPARTPAPGAPWWQRMGYVAAGVLVVAGLFGVLQNVGMTGGGEDAAATGTTAAAERAGTGAPAEGIPFVAQDSEAAAPSTTAAASEEALGAADGGSSPPFAALAEEARSTRSDLDPPTAEQRDCITRAGLEGDVVVREVEEAGTEYLVVMPEDASAEDTVVFVQLPDCRIVHEEG